MRLTHIDNSFFKLTTKQAKTLCGDFGLPREGYERVLDASTLAAVELGEMRQGQYRPWQSKASEATSAGVQRTRVEGKMVWALRLYFSPQAGMRIQY